MAPTVDKNTGRPTIKGYHKHPSACSFKKSCQVCMDNFIDAGKKTGGRDATVTVPGPEALATIKDHVASITRDYNALRATIAVKGDKILARWKNSSKRREKVIRTAFSDLPAEKWGHLYTYMTSGTGLPPSTNLKPFRQQFLLPYMTRDAFLQDSSRLMQLLFLRSEHAPPQWAWMDHQLTRFGRHSGMLATRFSDTIFATPRVFSEYGKPENFETHKFHAREQVGFPVAEILFEAQRDLYRILRTAMELILEGAEEKNTTTNEAWMEQGVQSFIGLRPKDYNGTSIHVPIQPFEAPLQYSLTRMRDLVAEREAIVEFDIWLLQTDLISAIQSVNALQVGDFPRDMDSAEKWARIAFQFTQPLLSRARFWSPFNEYIDMIEFAHLIPERPEEVKERVKQGRQLPLHVDMAFAATRELFSHYLKEDFPRILEESALVDPYFDNTMATLLKRLKRQGWGTTRRAVVDVESAARARNTDGRQCFDADPILWILLEMMCIKVENHSMLEGALPILEDILVGSKGYPNVDLRRLEQTRIIDMFEDFAAGLSIQSMLEAHRPKFRPITQQEATDFHASVAGHVMFETVRRKRKADGRQGQLYRSSSRKCWNWEEEDVPEVFAKAGALLKRFHAVAPSAQPRATHPWWSKALEAKSALDAFWAEIRELEIQSLLANPDLKHLELTRAVVEEFKDVRVLDFYKETDFVDGVQSAIARDQAKKTQAANKRKVDDKEEQSRLDEAVFQATLASPPKKSKVQHDRKDSKDPKRKDLPTCSAPQTPAPIARPPTPPPLPKILASSTSMDILARMWPHASGTYNISPTRFNQVVATMFDLGYACSPGPGAIWHFAGPGGMVSVHRPHGNLSTEVDRRKLQHYGRQLYFRYGWTFDRFEQRP